MDDARRRLGYNHWQFEITFSLAFIISLGEGFGKEVGVPVYQATAVENTTTSEMTT